MSRINILRLVYAVGLLISISLGFWFIELGPKFSEFTPLMAFMTLFFAGMSIVVENSLPQDDLMSREEKET